MVPLSPPWATCSVPCSAPALKLQRRRRVTQAAFFALFLAAPALDLLRFDLHEAQLWFLGARWTLGIAEGGSAAARGILLRGIAPALLLAGGFLFVAYRYGRLYCGWLCPHFSLVELLNRLCLRATGRFSLWERPQAGARRSLLHGALFVGAAFGFGALWAITLLSYLLPPAEVWGGLLHGTSTPNQLRFLAIATLLIGAELLLARHLFCRFGCAVGFFQSLAWMANPKALVMSFARDRAAQCRDCSTAAAPQGEACEQACPMRLQPRREKRWMFSCVQCGRCTQACAESQAAQGRGPSLEWRVDVAALRETLRRKD